MVVPATFVELCAAQQEKKISNVIGVVIDMLPSTVTQKGDHMLTFTLCDGTLQHGQKCRLFTKRQSDLPAITSLGDVLILRTVRFSYIRGQGLLSNMYGQPAPWAVLPAASPKTPGIFGSTAKYLKSSNMPAVTDLEKEYVMSLIKTQDQSKFTHLTDEVKEKLTSGSKSRSTLIKDLMLDSFAQVVGEVVKTFYLHGRIVLYIADYTENNMLYDYGKSKDKHELDENARTWPGPPGRFTLLIDCWPPHADWLQENVSVGDFVRLRNVHIKSNRGQQGLLEGLLHEDKIHQDTIYATKLKKNDVEELLLRKEKLGWGRGFSIKEEDEVQDTNEKKRKLEHTEKPSRNQRRREEKARLRKEADRMRDLQTKQEHVPPAATPRTEVRIALDSVNDNIRSEQGPWPERTIAEIFTATKPPMPNKTTEITSYATVRVKDFKPANIESFAQAVEGSDDDEIRSSASSTDTSDNDSNHSETSQRNKSTQVRRQKWVWKFALLLEDASPGNLDKDSGHNQMIVWVTKSDAEYLLGMRAMDLTANPRSLAQLREKLFLLWGELEEFKQAEARRKQERQASALEEVSINTSSAGSSGSSQETRTKSRPFRCLIEEYGELVGDRWTRNFKIKGTTIMQESISNVAAKQGHYVAQSWDNIDDKTLEITRPQISVRAPRAG